MEPAKWFAIFNELHAVYKKGNLPEADLQSYMSKREELARSFAQSQDQQVPDGQLARKHFRVPHMWNIELNALYKSVTKEVSCSQIVALVPSSFKEGEKISFSLSPTRSEEPISGQAIVSGSMKQGSGNSRVVMTIDHMSDENAKRLENFLFDALLSRIGQ